MKSSAPNLPESIFTLKESISLGVSRYDLSKLIAIGEVQKVSHGLYEKINKNNDEFIFDVSMFERVYARSKGEGCICLWSALEFYDLTEEFIEKAWIYVPYKKIIRVAEARAVRKRDLMLETGVLDMKSFKITSLERTLIDCLTGRKHISVKDSLDMCRRSISLKKTNLKKIVEMAKSLGKYKQVEFLLGLLV